MPTWWPSSATWNTIARVVLYAVVITIIASMIRSCSTRGTGTTTALSPGLIVFLIILCGLVAWATHSQKTVSILFWILTAFLTLYLVGLITKEGVNTTPWLIWLIVFVLVGVLLYFCREQRYIAIPAVVIAGVILIVFLGEFPSLGRVDSLIDKFKELMTLPIMGLPIFIGLGIQAYRKTDGGLKTFLGCATAVIILAWFWQFGKAMLGLGFDIDIDLDKYTQAITEFVSRPMVALFIVIVLCGIAYHYIVKGKTGKFAIGAIFLILLLMLIGKDTITSWISRLPSQIQTPASIGRSIGNIGKSVGKLIPKSSSSQSQPSPSPASPTHTAPKAEKWVEYTRIDFGRPEFASLTNPIARVDNLPKGAFRFSETVPTRIGNKDGFWPPTNRLNYDSAEPIFIKPLSSGNDKKTVIIYVREE